MVLELTQEEVSAALERTMTELLWEVGIIQPPVDAIRAAERLGLAIATDLRSVHRGRFVRMAAGAESMATSTILLAPEMRSERRQWAVAHEIGEWAAGRIADRLGVDPGELDGQQRERWANAFAGAFLLPRRWFLTDGHNFNWDLLALKDRFATASHELIARRMLEMPAPAVITLFDHGRPVWRRATEGLRVPPMLLAEEACHRQVHLRGTPAEIDSDRDDVARVCVRCWPVHEQGWRREIMRTELQICEDS
jgi:Zn-dependent peptidase ImmA (M78 family)